MADIVKFVQTPSYVLMDKCTKEQLLRITEHYETKISDTRLKESSIKVELKNKLIEQGILSSQMEQTQDTGAHTGAKLIYFTVCFNLLINKKSYCCYKWSMKG